MSKLPVPAKKKRPADSNMRMHSILADAIAISNQLVKSPRPASPKRRKK